MKLLAVAGAMMVLGSSFAGTATAGAPAQTQTPQAWRGCCGATAWPQGDGMMGQGMGSGMMGHGMMGGAGSMARHRAAMMGGGVPEPYSNLSNPLPRTAATVNRGAAVYAANCASCHGLTGLGDGAAARDLSPRPANLAWLSNMPMSGWDPYMYWTIAEGGAALGSAMPAFKNTLSKDDIWTATAYIQAHLPQAKAAR